MVSEELPYSIKAETVCKLDITVVRMQCHKCTVYLLPRSHDDALSML